MTPPVTNRTLCILGMHRSGTSCLAGVLEQGGVFLGDVFTRNRFNARGNRENARIMQLHESLLRDNGGSWDAPPEVVRWSDAARRERDAIIAGYAGEARWGFKDPRTLLALAGWREALPGLETVGTFRHPLAVAASLNHRNGMALDRAVRLWTRYNQALLTECQRSGTPLVCFDHEESGFRAQLTRLGRRLGSAADLADTGFFTSELRHHHDAPNDPRALPPAAEALYRQLCACVV